VGFETFKELINEIESNLVREGKEYLFYQDEETAILCCDVLEGLKSLPDKSVQMVMTSPPYWGLRDYGDPRQIGLEPTWVDYIRRLVEVFREIWRVLRDDGAVYLNMGDTT